MLPFPATLSIRLAHTRHFFLPVQRERRLHNNNLSVLPLNLPGQRAAPPLPIPSLASAIVAAE